MQCGRAIQRWLFLVPASRAHDIAQILALSAVVQAFFLLTAFYCVPGGALEFVVFGKALVSLLQGHLQVAPTVADRSIGYPSLLVLSGFFQNGSLIGITIIQGLMAMWIPVLIYLTILPVSILGAYYIALASIISLGPFLFVKWLYHDQAYVFLCIVTLWAISKFVHSKKSVDLFLLALAITATSLTRPAGGLLFPVLILVVYTVVRGSYGRYLAVTILFIALSFANHFLRAQLLYAPNVKTNEYTGGQIFYNFYINSSEYGITLSSDLGPGMKEVTDDIYQVMLPSPRSSKFLSGFYDMEAPPSDFRNKVIVPFLNKYFYPYSADEFREQLYRNPNWEYYFLIFSVVPDSVLLKASWEVVKSYPLYPLLFTFRNLWYFLYSPGYFHTQFNPIPIFHGGLFYPFDGQAAIGGGAFGANAAIQGLPGRATKELSFDSLVAQPEWIKQTYDAVRVIWLDSYDAIQRAMFYLMVAAWVALIVNWIYALSRWSALRKWSEVVNANRLATHILYVTVFLLYNLGIVAAFADPDYRYNDMAILIKVILSGFGAMVIIRVVRETFGHLTPLLNKSRAAIPVCNDRPERSFAVAISTVIGIAVCVSWAWYVGAHAW